MLCAACADEGRRFPASPGCRRWLAAIARLSPSLLARYTLDAKSFREAKAMTMAIMTEALGRRPASWDIL
jgi:hypothetical protein